MCIPVKWASIFHFNAMLIGSQFCLAFFLFYLNFLYIYFFIVSVYILCVSTRLSWRPHLLTSAFLQRTKPGTALRAILSTIGMFAGKFYTWLIQRKKTLHVSNIPVLQYLNFHATRCANDKGDETADCEKFAKYYRSLCPGEWVSACAVFCSTTAFFFLHLARI